MDDDQEDPTKWKIFLQLLRLAGQCCWVICPPVPELITRKLAFHPPAKGLTYEIYLEDGTKVDCAKKVLGKKFTVKLNAEELSSTLDMPMVNIVEPFTVTTEYGNHLIGVRFGLDNVSLSGPEKVIIFSQPNSSDIGHMLHPNFAVLHHMALLYGVEIFAYDYSGYGYSTGSPSEKNIYADVKAVYEHVRKVRPNAQIVLMGFSIGTTVSINLASQKPENLAGVVLMAAFWSGLNLLRNRTVQGKDGVAEYVDRFRNIDRIGLIDVPVLLIHGTDDVLVPVQQSKEMHKMLKKPVTPLYICGATHASILTRPETFQRIRCFLTTEIVLSPVKPSESTTLEVE